MYSDSPTSYPVQFGQPDSIIRPLNEIRPFAKEEEDEKRFHYTRTEILKRDPETMS